MSIEEIKEHFVDGPIAAEFIASQLRRLNEDISIGAHSIFLGQVRKESKYGTEVTKIEYSAYAEMANIEFEKILEEIKKTFPGVKVEVFHSIGTVRAGEISMFVMTAARHRKDTFKALEQTVDMIKANVPIWKKEIFTDGTSKWIE